MVTKSKSDLLSGLENATGKEKMEILNQLAGLWDLPPNERIAFAKQAVDLSEEFHDHRSKAESLNHLGIAYNNLGDSQKSIDCFLKALQIMEQLDDKSGIAISYRNLGQANFYLDNFDKALEYFQRALRLQEEIGNEQDISQVLILVGNVKAKTAAYDEALDYYFKALVIKEKIDDKQGIAQIYNNLGNVFLDTAHYDKALEYRLKALQIDREFGDKWEIANATYNIAEQYLKNKEPEKAYPYLLESQKLAQDLDNKGLVRDNLHNFSLYYELEEDYQKALYYQRACSELTQSLFSEELGEKITEMQIKYETEKLEKAVAERTQELQQKVYELEQTEKALRESEQRLALAVTGTGLGLWDWMVQTGETVFNERWAEIVGYTIEELAPVSIDTWIKLTHPDDLEKSNELLTKYFAGKTDHYICEARMKHKNGSWVWVLDRGKTFEWDEDGKPARMAGTRLDITERKRTEETLRQRQFQLTILNQVGRALAETLELGRIYRIAYEHVAQLVDCPCFGISLYDPPTRTLRAEFMLDEGELIDPARFPPMVMDAEPTQGRVRAIATRQTEIIADYPAALEKATDVGVRVGVSKDEQDTGAAMYVPMVARGQVTGLLEVQSYRLDAYSADHAELLGLVANQIGLAIQNARLYQQVQRHAANLERRVAERTAELRNLVNAMAGREVRMAELKEVIRQLRAQLEAAGLTPAADDPLAPWQKE